MPDLYLNIKADVDPKTIADVSRKLDELQKKFEASAGGSGGDGKSDSKVKKETEALKKLNIEFKRKLTLNEVQFRQGKLSKEQALQNAKAIEKQAMEQGVLTNQTLKGVQAQKTAYLSQQRIQAGFKGMASTSQTANQSLVNLGRIVQDLPFGFLGISNNIDPMLSSFRKLSEESGGTWGAIKKLGGSILGGGGLIFALGSLLPTLMLVSQMGFNMFKKSAKSARVEVKDVISALGELRDFGTFSFLDRDKIEREIDTIKDIRPALDEIVKARKAYDAQIGDTSRKRFLSGAEDERIALETLEKQYGFTFKEAKALIKIQGELADKLEQVNAVSSFASLAKYREEIEKSVDRTKLMTSSGLETKETLETFAEIYFKQARALKELGLETDEQRVKYEILTKAGRELMGAYEQYPEAVQTWKNSNNEVGTGLDRLKEKWAQAKQKADEYREAQAKAIKDLPKEIIPDTDDKGLQQAFEAQEALVNYQLLQTEGLAQKKIQIENKYKNKILSLGKQALLDKDLLAQLELNKKQEIENAKTAIEEEEAQKRKQIQSTLVNTGFNMASNFVGALMQLNQSQTDQTEKQARAKFDKQKKLQKASAVVGGAQAIVRQFSDLPLPFAIPASAMVAGITALQIKAIDNTEFEGGGSAPTGAGGITITPVEEGFAQNGAPQKPVSQNVNLTVNNQTTLDRKGLYYITKQGEREYNNLQVQ